MDDIDDPVPFSDPKSVSEDKVNDLLTRLQRLEDAEGANDTDADAELREQQIREIKTRIWMRWIVLAVSVIMIGFMGLIMAHQLHHIFAWKFLAVPRSFAIALVVAPSVSMTTVTVALLVGAFRNYKDSDDQNFSSVAIEGAKQALGGN